MRELALHILDLLQNTVEAGARHTVLTVEEDLPADALRIVVTDDGRGMAAETARRVADPFFTTRSTRHVGLGLPLLSAAAQRAGGSLSIRSQPGAGTTIEANFQLSHPDRQPLGDMVATLLAFLAAQDGPELSYCHRLVDASGRRAHFEFESAAIRSMLGDLPITHPAVTLWLAEYFAEGEAGLCQD